MNLKGVVVDAGHGGTDPGASGNEIVEKDLTLLISKYIYERLKELNIPVKLTRETDETINPDERINRILSSFGNTRDVIVISNHINAGGGEGAEVIYALRDDSKLANVVLNNIGLTGQNKRKVYQRRLLSDISKDYYYILRDTGKTEPIIVEYGFIDNDVDVDFLLKNYKELGEAVVKSILEYKNIPYVEPITEIADTYTVMKGDTLYSIANKLNTTVFALKKLNNLSTNMLTIGQILKIPTTAVDIDEMEIYKVQSGDTLYSIAKKYDMSVNELKAINNLIGDELTVGQLLSVPNKLSTVNVYTVMKGDTLYSIAKDFDISVNKLKEVNNFTNNLLNVGDKLIIPVDEVTTYVVKRGDTLYSIAKEFDISVDKLKTLNNLESSLLKVGQILIVKDV